MIDTDYDDYTAAAPPAHLVCSQCAELLGRTNRILERLEAELTRPWAEPAMPPRPEHEVALEWLAALCGGPEAVEALGAAPLDDDGLDLPVVEDAVGRTQLEEVAALLDEVAADFPVPEVGFALRRALLRLWQIDPLLVAPPNRPNQVAAGIVWTVLGANGLAGPGGLVTATELKERLGVRRMPSLHGKQLAAALRGFWPWQTQRPWGLRDLPDLEPLGCPDLLVSSVRRRLVRLRDQAYSVRDGGSPR